MCSICQFEDRNIWPPIHELPKRSIVEKGDYIFLVKCDNCGSLWVESVYEPYLSYTYLVKWNYKIEDWILVNTYDNSKTLLNWHINEIKLKWKELNKKREINN